MNEPLKQPVNDAACSQLEKSWFANEPIAIEACLEGLSDEELVGTSEELICIEMEFLWKQWARSKAVRLKVTDKATAPTSVEEYLQRFPQLDSLQHQERLASEEISCRLQVGDRVNPAEYRQRFPKLVAESSLVQGRLNTLQQQHDTGHEEQTMVAPAPSDQVDQTGQGHPAAAEGTLHGTPTGSQAKDTYIGKELGGYKILNEVGRGGMGVVYKAFDTKLKRIVALKVLRNMVHSDAAELDRFLGEATAAAQIAHPNIISVFEIEKDEEAPFVVLEFASGGALNDRIDGTPFAAEKAAQLVLTLAEAIHAAHEKGIVHRDLKPGNVVFTSDDEVKITDFGLAKWIDTGSDLTKSGEIVGTPSYMAPEQVTGKSGVISARTDVYALGVILYELLTGRPPFTGSSSINTVLHVMKDDPVPPNQLQSEIGHDLNTICLKCLEKQPEKRYETAAQLAGDLRAYLEDRPITARRPSTVERTRKWIRRHPATSGFLAVATLIVLALIYTGIQVNQRLQAEKDTAQENAQAAIEQREQANRLRDEAENEKTQAETARNVAQQEKEKAVQARTEAQENESRAIHAQYVNSISLMQQDLKTSNFNGALARLNKIKNNPRMAQHRQLEWDFVNNNQQYFRKLVPVKTDNPRRLERLAVHPDRELVVTGSNDGFITLWDLETSQPLLKIPPESPGPITTITWISESALLVCNLQTGAHRYQLETDPDKQLQLTKQKTLFHGRVQAAAIHKSTMGVGESYDQLAVGIQNPQNGTSELVIMDLQSGKELKRMFDEPKIESLAYNHDGSQLAIGTAISLVLYAQTPDGWERREIKGTKEHKRRPTPHTIESVLFVEKNNKSIVIAAGHDGIIRGWDPRTSQKQFELQGHASMIQGLSLDTTNNRLASCSNDRSVIVWDLDREQRYKVFDEHEAEVLQVQYHKQGRQLFSVGHDGNLIIRDFDLFRPTSNHEMNGNLIHAFSANDSETYMMVVSRHHLGLWNIDDRFQPLEPVPEPPQNPTDPVYNCAIALPNDSGWLVGDRAGHIHHLVQNEENKLERKSPSRKSKNAEIVDLAMHPDGKRFVSVGFPHQAQPAVVELWNVDDMESTVLQTFNYRLFAVAIDSSGQYLAYAGDTHQQQQQSLFVYDLKSQEPPISLKHDFPRAIFDLQFQPQTQALAVVGDSPHIALFHGNNWHAEPKKFHGHNYFLNSVIFTENGKRIISSGKGGTIRIWDVELKNPLLELTVPSDKTDGPMAVLEKQKRILTGYENLYSWDYATPDQAK